MTAVHADRVAAESTGSLRVLAAVAVAALGVDLAVRSGVISVAGTLLVVVATCGLAAQGRLTNPQARALVALSPAFGVFLSLRASEWLAALDVAAAGGLLLAGASFARGGTVLDLRISALRARAVHALDRGLMAPGFLARALPVGRAQFVPPVARGLALAVPLVVVLGALLASGDAVFATLFRLPLDPSEWVARLALWLVGAWAMGGLSAVAASEPPPAPDTAPPRLGFVEAAVVLAGLVALYAGYLGTRLVAMTKGEQWVQERAGLTYAEYARSGFFQLLGVAVITLLTLSVLRACTARDRRLTGFALTAVALTLGLVAVAVHRLHLYERAFGLTVPRLVATVFALWVGAVFVLLAASWLGVGRGRSWLPAGATAVALALLFALNAMDPEAVVVRRNLARADFDLVHATGLSDDAVPAVLARFPEAGRVVCNGRSSGRGWAGWNRAARRADAACEKTGFPDGRW